MLKRLFLYLILCSVTLVANEPYSIYKDNDDFFAKIDGIRSPVKLHIGAGMPQVLSLEPTKNKDIKLLKCFGGDVGTSVLVGYYYTYILDFKKEKIVGFIEYYDDYGHYSKIDKKPKWNIKKEVIEVRIYDEEKEGYKSVLFNLNQ